MSGVFQIGCLMLQSAYFEKILEFNTFIIDDHRVIARLFHDKTIIKCKSNIIYRMSAQKWQGAYFLKYLNDKMEEKGFLFFLECNCNYGEVMAYMRMGLTRFAVTNTKNSGNKSIKKFIKSFNGCCFEIDEFKLVQNLKI